MTVQGNRIGLHFKKAWEYYFFVDVLGHCEDAPVKKGLAELAKHTMFVKVLGSYPNVNG